jgi:epidermal growth factor receptor substrate 15
MYLIEALKECRLSSVPSSIPPHITEQLANVILVKPKPRSPLVSSDGRMSSPFYDPSQRPSPMAPPKFSPTLPPIKNNGRSVAWDVLPSEKLESDKHFMILDSNGTGFVEEDDAVKFLMRYKLSFSVLAQILCVFRVKVESFEGLTCLIGLSLAYVMTIS